MTDRRSATTPAAIAAVLGVVAFAAGVSKKWILSPIGDAFGDLSPDGKVIVVAVLVVGIIGLLAFARMQHRSAVQVTRRMIETTSRSAGPPDEVPS